MGSPSRWPSSWHCGHGSLTLAFRFGPSFLRSRATWLLAVPAWLLLLLPTREARVALDIRETALGIARAAGVLLIRLSGGCSYFYAGRERLPRLVRLYIFGDRHAARVFGWRLVALWSP